MNDLAQLARAAGTTQASLLALSPANDPFSIHQPARRRNAEWFAELFEKFGFGWGVHLRRIHYRFVSHDTPLLRPDGKRYINTTSAWQMLINAARDARYHGLVPDDFIVDRRNPAPQIFFQTRVDGSPEVKDCGLYLAEPDQDFPDLPSIELVGAEYGPPAMVELWAEKTSMNDVLVPIVQRYHANLVTGVGEMSKTSVRGLLVRGRAAKVPTRILYISDFDPAGRSMPVAVARKIEFEEPDLDITLNPIVLTEAQCAEYRLPRTPIKESERRAEKFEARFGKGATELDALEALHPGALDRIVSAEIERYIDPDYARAYWVALQEHKQVLSEISERVHERYQDQIDDLEDQYNQLVRWFGEFRTKAEEVFEQIADDLNAVEVPTFDPPVPRKPNEPPAPLFDASRDYLTQIDHYHSWQGRGETEK